MSSTNGSTGQGAANPGSKRDAMQRRIQAMILAGELDRSQADQALADFINQVFREVDAGPG